MADERIGLQLDLGQSTPKAREFADALNSISVTASANVAPALHKIDDASKQAHRASMEFGRGIQSVSYIAQDFTSVLSGGGGLARALSSVQNNIPQLLTQFGAGAGMAGVVSLAAISVGLLYEQSGRLIALWDGGATAKEAENQKKLAKATDEARIALEKQVEAARNQKSATEKATGSAVTGVTGGDAFDKAVQNAMGMDEQEFTQRRNELEQLVNYYKQVQGQARGKGQRTKARAAGELIAETEAAVKALDKSKSSTEELVTEARNGNMGAFDELLRRTSGDVHDELNAIDPRKAGMRDMAQDRAKAQIGDAIGDFINPLVTGLKDRRLTEKQAIDQAGAIDAQGEMWGREAKKIIDADKRKADAEEKKADARDDKSAKQERDDREKERRDSSRKLLENPFYSKDALRAMDQKQVANNDIQRILRMQDQGLISAGQAQMQVGTIQQQIIQIQSKLDALQRGARAIDTRMGRVRN